MVPNYPRSDATATRPTGEPAPISNPLPLGDARESALASFLRAVSGSEGYRAWLQAHGVDPETIDDLNQVPFLTKDDVFSGDVTRWVEGGLTEGAAELLTSSGQSGSFSVGVNSRAEQRALQASTDEALRAAGADESSSTLLLNCLPMGITVPTSLATVATPSVHLDMAQELYERLGPNFDRVVILAEPVFLKEFAERLFAHHGAAWTATTTICVVGGEWIAESWRRYVGGLFGMPPTVQPGTSGILISMGAAELGINLLFETPELRTVRSLIDESGLGSGLFSGTFDYTPTLFAYDPRRLYVEERVHPDGRSTLAFTPLTRRLLPLVRYDLGDLGEVLPPERVNARLAAMGLEVRTPVPVIAFWGRESAGLEIGGRTIRPELVKQRLFTYSAEAAVLTGRFYLAAGPPPVIHLQLRPDTIATPGLAADLSAFLTEAAGMPTTVELHSYRDYPYHLAGDFQRKPVYHAVSG
jgi:phenylacetate-CoA ligase